MDIKSLEVKNILYPPQGYNPWLDYLSLQEKFRLAEVFEVALQGAVEPGTSAAEMQKWKSGAKVAIKKEFVSAQEYFGLANFLQKFDLDKFLQSLLDEPENSDESIVDTLAVSINRYFSFETISSSEVLDLKNFEPIKYKAYSFVDNFNRDSASRFANNLGTLLSKTNPNNNQEKQIYRILNFWVLRLKIFAFPKLKLSEQSGLIKDQIIEILNYGLDLKNALIQTLEKYDSEEVRKEVAENYKTALNNCGKILGGGTAFTKQNNFQPSISNWLQDYFVVTKADPDEGMGPGAFHIVKFMDSNKNVRLLTPDEKQVLQQLLEFYNLLFSPNILVPQEPTYDTTDYITQQRFELPAEIVADNQTPVENKIKVQPDIKPLFVLNSPPENLQPKAPIIPSVNPPAPSQPAKPKNIVSPISGYVPAPTINIQDILKSKNAGSGSGLSLGNLGTKSASPPPVPTRKPQAQMPPQSPPKKPAVDIDRKLEELKKKIG